MFRSADDFIACSALRRYPDLARFLRKRFSNDQSFLHQVLEFDAELRKEFLATAGKTEINAWLWEREEHHGRDFKTKPKVQVESATATPAVRYGKNGQRCGRRC